VNIATFNNPIVRRTALGLSAFIIALLTFLLEQPVLQWLSDRSTALSVVLFVLVLAMFASLLRRFLVITLCFSVGMFTFRGGLRVATAALPSLMRYTWGHALWEGVLLLVGVMAVFAGLTETIQPNSVLARRVYFAAGGIFFLWQAFVLLFAYGSLRSVFYFVTGIAAVFAAAIAHQFEDGASEAADIPNYDSVQQKYDSAHKASLKAKEWHDTVAKPVDESGTTSEFRLSTRQQ
jgi:hypothetical protein